MSSPSAVRAWLIVSFESRTNDTRELIEGEYDGLRLFVKPLPPEDKHADRIAVLMESFEEIDSYGARVNRFLSAMSWRDRRGYETLGLSATADRGAGPIFNVFIPRVRRGMVMGPYRFEGLPHLTTDEQRLALALYRDALCCNNAFYQFLSFFKIINLRHPHGGEQVAWIKSALPRVGSRRANVLGRLSELSLREADIGEYLYRQNRCAIAHAGYSTNEPIRDPDDPADFREVKQDLDLMQDLAELFVSEELGIT